VFATLFFLTLIYFSLCLFTKTGEKQTPSRRKLQRNIVYRVCGYTMAACLVLIALVSLFGPASLESYRPKFWLESVLVVAFGISWLTKGEAILRDVE
jgi:TRAP-type C4-dicarboxylate transport system permease small subunit